MADAEVMLFKEQLFRSDLNACYAAINPDPLAYIFFVVLLGGAIKGQPILICWGVRAYLQAIGLDPNPVLVDGRCTGAGPSQDPAPKGGGGGAPPPLYGPQKCRTEQCALSAPEVPRILF